MITTIFLYFFAALGVAGAIGGLCEIIKEANKQNKKVKKSPNGRKTTKKVIEWDYDEAESNDVDYNSDEDYEPDEDEYEEDQDELELRKAMAFAKKWKGARIRDRAYLEESERQQSWAGRRGGHRKGSPYHYDRKYNGWKAPSRYEFD